MVTGRTAADKLHGFSLHGPRVGYCSLALQPSATQQLGVPASALRQPAAQLRPCPPTQPCVPARCGQAGPSGTESSHSLYLRCIGCRALTSRNGASALLHNWLRLPRLAERGHSEARSPLSHCLSRPRRRVHGQPTATESCSTLFDRDSGKPATLVWLDVSTRTLTHTTPSSAQTRGLRMNAAFTWDCVDNTIYEIGDQHVHACMQQSRQGDALQQMLQGETRSRDAMVQGVHNTAPLMHNASTEATTGGPKMNRAPEPHSTPPSCNAYTATAIMLGSHAMLQPYSCTPAVSLTSNRSLHNAPTAH